MNKQRGFTLLELVIVVVIIVMLVLLVIVGIEGYVDKSKDSAIKTNLVSIMMNGSSWGLVYTTFSDFCGSPDVQKHITAIADIGPAAVCNSNAEKWCACSPLTADSSYAFCVDSSGKQMESAGPCSAVCPVSAPACQAY